MAISTFMGLQTSLRGLLAHQQAIDTTSHNVSNANTEGYSRQEATLTATDAMKVVGTGNGGVGSLGTGVTVQQYTRTRDGFLGLQDRAQNMEVGGQEGRAGQRGQVELSRWEAGENGVASQRAKFWGGGA